jgi:hypothetical protein
VGLRVAVGLLVIASTAHAQDRFEIQVYDVETAPRAGAGIETHINVVADGTTHLTFEPHVGLASWCELGAYIQTAFLPDGSAHTAGVKLRWKARLPRRYARGLIGLALNIELSSIPAFFEPNVWGSELRPIIDVRWKRLYVSFNPIIDIDLAGAQAGRPQFQPALKIAVTVHGPLALGVEYYAAFGPLTDIAPIAQQLHRLLGVVDIVHKFANGAELTVNLAGGYNLAGGNNSDKWVVKSIIGYGR